MDSFFYPVPFAEGELVLGPIANNYFHIDKLIIPKVTKVTMMPATITPAPIEIRARFRGMPKTKAIKAPVQAPVPGKGMATKIAKAKSPKIFIFLECFLLVFSKSQVKKRLKI